MLENTSTHKIKLNSTDKLTDKSDSQVRSILLMVRLTIFVILCGLAAGLGIGAYALVSNQEFNRFNRNLDAMSTQVSNGFSNYYSSFQFAQKVTGNIFKSHIHKQTNGTMPFVTLPGIC